MITSLQSHEIDVAIGLTEGWVAGIGKAQEEGKEAEYRMVGTYVETPLCWAISTGGGRGDVKGVEGLRGGKMGVSRIGRWVDFIRFYCCSIFVLCFWKIGEGCGVDRLMMMM